MSVSVLLASFVTDCAHKLFWDKLEEDYPTEHDYLVAHVRAFRDHNADFIIIDDRRMEFQIQSSQFGETLGILTSEFIEIDEQSTQMRYRLTDLGREIIMNPEAHNRYVL